MPNISLSAVGFLVMLCVVSSYGVGYRMGGSAERVRQLAVTVEAVKKRSSIDRDLARQSDVAICVALGGERSDCDEIEGVGSADE